MPTPTTLTRDQITQAAYNAGFRGADLNTAVAIAQAESSGQPGAVGDQGTSFGLWQIHTTVHTEFTPSGMMDPQANANAAFALYSARGNQFGDWTTYNTGAYISHLDPNGPQPANTTNGGTTAPQNVSSDDLPSRAPSDYVNLPDQVISDATYQQLNPDLVITEGLDVTPWYEDKGLVTGNPRIRSFVAPISFRMLIKGTPLSNGKDGLTGKPLEVQLNASIKRFNKTMKHVYTKTLSRTGVHITLWGQQADMIQAECTTGVFMNQLGLTDFLSTMTVGNDLIQLINQGFAHKFDADTEEVSVFESVKDQMTDSSASAFRVAAQDAFVELLSMFKCNGNVWFHPTNYNGQLSGYDQAGISAWSPNIGTSSTQGNARNNDVITRGAIALQLKGSTYLGYFKSLSWTMDANDPFQWHFNFVFQVERTIELFKSPATT